MMNILQIIKEEISRFNISESIWYHGSADAREIKSGGFTPRVGSTSIITDPQKDSELQSQMNDARKSGDEKLYHKLLDQKGLLFKDIKYKKPIYFSNNRAVARTYADPHRANDYQKSEPETLTYEIDDTPKTLKISAYGESFRGIQIDIVKRALLNDGHDEQTIDRYLNMFKTWTRNGRMSAETLAAIAQQFGYEMIDVQGVLDSYHVGKTKSTVRMVFDPKYIREVK